jgi:hypothetical protein
MVAAGAGAGGQQVRVEGLDELRSALRQVDRTLEKDLTRRMRTRVAGPVADKVRDAVPTGPGRGGHWRSAIRGGATSRAAYVQWGRGNVPYAPWIEFGGQLPSKRSGRPARVRRPYVPDGRYVHPTVRAAGPMALEAANEALQQTLARARLALD